MSANISIFVPHSGCPHKCSFCDQNAITGKHSLPSAADVTATVEKGLEYINDPKSTEIAFFGGSFTAIDRAYMTELTKFSMLWRAAAFAPSSSEPKVWIMTFSKKT